MRRIVADAYQSALRRACALAGAALLALQLCGCAWLDTQAARTGAAPDPDRPTDVAALRPGDLRFTVAVASASGEAEHLALWWLPHPDPNAPTLLYLHGTFRNLYQNRPKIEALRKAGFAILAVDYRGWGDSTPIVPSEQTIVADARQAWENLCAASRIPGGA